jgi:ParB-like chromosome segregation protein Spo0J
MVFTLVAINWSASMTISERLAAKAKQEKRTKAKFDYPVHPVAQWFPKMDDESYEALKVDIEAHGQSEPIVLWKKQLIDGRHRLRACKELGIKPIVTDIPSSEDPLAYVISHNLHRRHLNTSQRAMIASKIANLGEGRPTKETAHKCAVSAEEAAATLSVSRRSVVNANQVIEHGAKAVQKAVEQGKLAVTTAAELATSVTKPEQTKAVKGGKDAIKGVLKKPKPDKPLLTKAEQFKAERKKAKSYTEYLQRSIDDLNRIKRNTVQHPELINLCGQILKGLERW